MSIVLLQLNFVNVFKLKGIGKDAGIQGKCWTKNVSFWLNLIYQSHYSVRCLEKVEASALPLNNEEYELIL